MLVTLDAALLDGDYSTDGTLQALIDDVRSNRLGQRIVVGVTLDGRPLLNDELTERLSQPLGDVDAVGLVSADIAELARDALVEAAEQLGAAAAGQDAIAEHFHAGEVAEAVKGFGEFLSAWQTCQQVILECSRLLGRDLTAEMCGGATVRDHLDGLAERLRQLRDAFEARDTVLLADMVQYELPDICESWGKTLRELADGLVVPASA